MANITEQTMQQMNTQTTTSSGVSPLFEAVVNRTILESAKEKNVFNQFGKRVTVPKGKTKAITFDRMEPMDVTTESLKEGVTPAGDVLNISRMTINPKQYGHYISVTDEFEFFKHDPSPEVLKKAKALGEQAQSTFDLLTLNELKKGTNYQYAGGKATVSAITADDKMTVKEVMKAVRTLKANKAEPESGNDFVCIIDPYMAYDLMLDERWQNVKDYDPKDMYNGEIGKLFGVRFVDTTQNMEFEEKGSGGITLHRAIFFGKDAYASTKEKGNIVSVNQPATDPLHQNSTTGWKGHHAAAVLTEGWMLQVVAAVSE